VNQAGEREFPAQERGQTRVAGGDRTRGQTNGRLGGLGQKNENGRFLRRDPVRGLVLVPVLDPVLNPGKDQHPHPVLRIPGTAAVRLSVKDKSLGPDPEVEREVDQEAQEGTG
jgi:hypothetical protein